MKHIALIGSTGSIGRQVTDVCVKDRERYRIVAICAGTESDLFLRQKRALSPKYARTVSKEGVEACLELCSLEGVDIVFVACSGFAGIKYTLSALEAGKRVALANKESMVCAGELIMPRYRDRIIPVDSEHSAIWQCLGYDLSAPFERIILTASGGPFLGREWDSLTDVTPKETLCHPTWKMGKKITVDCATLLNKGYEIIEAHHLFNAPYDKICAVLHPQSVIHSLVEFADGACLAQLSVPDMKLPIQLALSFPKRIRRISKRLDFMNAFSLDFRPLDEGMYPCFNLALECGKTGGTAPTILNAASEVADGAFLQGRIKYKDIYTVLCECADKAEKKPVTCLEDVEEADRRSRETAEGAIGNLR